MHKTLGLLCLMVFVWMPVSTPAATAPEAAVASPDDWIERVESVHTLPDDGVHPTAGEYFLLVDKQIQVSSRHERFHHYAIALMTQEAVENNSQISVTFDPSYEQLTLHAIRLWREGKAIDQLDAGKIQMLQRERQLEELVYDGRWTASLILEDVRQGDILEYSYTLSGSNPAYADHFNVTTNLQWAIPVLHSNFRLLWPTHRPLTLTPYNTEQKPDKVTHGKYDEYRMERRKIPALRVESESPSWYSPWPRISFSDFSGWDEVVAWALPHYTGKHSSAPEIQSIAERISASHETTASQVAEALHFVQREVRYLGLAMGVGSHVPTPPEVTLQRRYGDCKAKTLLLLTILDALGVEAHAALVNTRYGMVLEDDGAQISAFDHVIVQATVDGSTFWLDPTLNDQKGELDSISQPDYDLALVIHPGSNKLVPMKADQGLSRRVVDEFLDLRTGIGEDKQALLQIKTTYSGAEAEKLRNKLNAEGTEQLQKDYLNYYAKQYSAIELQQPLKVTDDHPSNRIEFTEHYSIPNIWSDNKDESKWEVEFFSDAFYWLLDKPDEIRRTAPFEVPFPANITQTITVLLPDTWNLSNDETKIDTPFFSFEQKTRYHPDEHELVLWYHFEALTDNIPGDEIDAYLSAIDQVWDALDYRIYSSYADSTTTEGIADSENGKGLLLVVSLVLGLLLYSFFEFWRDGCKAPAMSGRYYPVNSFKFLVLSVLTFNLYQLYWFYKNWSYVKKRDNSSIIPWGRALFSGFWYYPLLDSIQREPEKQPYNGSVRAGFALLAIGYFVANAASGMNNVFSYAAILLSPILMLPLVEQVNLVDNNENSVFQYNSRWRPRHAIIGLFFGSLLLLVFSIDINLVPGDTVIDGDDLWSHDRKFMHRAGITDVDEKIMAFYSNGTFSFSEDGNGFSDKAVFSYWKDDDGKLNVEKSAYSEISAIEPTYAKEDELSAIKVIRKDGSHFLLFITSSDGSDQRFVKRMNQQWQRSQEDQ